MRQKLVTNVTEKWKSCFEDLTLVEDMMGDAPVVLTSAKSDIIISK